MTRSVFEVCNDAELAAAIWRLSARLEKLDRNPHPQAIAEGLNVQAALDEAMDEQQRRATKAATASTLGTEG